MGKALAAKLKELIPRQQFKVPIQAAIGARIVASESIPGMTIVVFTNCCIAHRGCHWCGMEPEMTVGSFEHAYIIVAAAISGIVMAFFYAC